MSTLAQITQHNLQVLGLGHALARLADDVLRDYPEPYLLARRHARALLRKHTGKPLDPERVWWHQFNQSHSNSRSFSGWAHNGPPGKSISLVQLLIQRFDLPFQDAGDELDVYGGFYHQGPHGGAYDERNEVPMLGKDVQADLWALDLGARHREQVTLFWTRHADNFRVLAKVNLLAQLELAGKAGRVDAADAASLRQSVAPQWLNADVQSTVQALRRQTATTLPALHYALGASERAALCCLHLPNGHVLLYLPWMEQALRGFDSPVALAGWLRGELQEGRQRAAYQRALAADPHDQARAAAVGEALAALAAATDANEALALLDASARPLPGDFFTWLSERAREDMQRSAERMISNSELRKAMWRGYLGAFLRVFGGFAPLGWPATLVLLGASLGRTALDVDAAVHASDAKSRKAALRAAILDSLFSALGMVEVGFGSSFASLSYVAPFHETGVSLSSWTRAGSQGAGVLEARVANQVLIDPLQGPGLLRGITLGGDGQTWIELQGMPYRVRYSTDLGHWLIVPPDNPFAYVPLRPVRLSAGGQWELLQRPRLVGGNPPLAAGLERQGSPFWDEYMRTDGQRSVDMSNAALARHRAVLAEQDIPQLGEDEGSSQDDDGFCHIFVNGEPEYTYREGGHYRNDLIYTYTEEDSRINDYLREGRREFDHGDEVDYINKLADSMVELPRDNVVPLYRGGHGGRGTSGQHFRSGQLKVGDVLVNTDLASFTENPYIVRRFAADTEQPAPGGRAGLFDDTSVVFELPTGHYQRGVPISSFSSLPDEAETLFLPGSCFRIEALCEVEGADYHFVHVTLREIARPASGPLHDLRTGEVFDLTAYVMRLGNQQLASRFFED